MKNKSILSLIIALLGLGSVTTSCEDMLTPDMNRYTEDFSGKDTVYFYYGILRNVQEMLEQNKLVGDIRSDLADTTMYSSDSIANIAYFNREADGENELLNRAAYYKVVNQCNFYLAKADTLAKKNDIYFMRREYAQVLNIRAWAYLQLVQAYGRVPFITLPVDNANTGWETNPPGGLWADADNLVELLKKDLQVSFNFERRYGYPSYPSVNTGSGLSLSHRKMCFYSSLLLGDLYLLRGASRQDYVEAAKQYYWWLERIGRMENNYSVPNMTPGSTGLAYWSKREFGAEITYTPDADSWVNIEIGQNSRYHLTALLGAANSTFGKVLTRCVQVYGFDPSSRTNTSSDENGENVSQSGTISVSANYKNRQIGPSYAYRQLAANQIFTRSKLVEGTDQLLEVEYYPNTGDARIWGTTTIVETKDGTDRYVTKFSPASYTVGTTARSFGYNYMFSLYRFNQVMLRYAEALNRAGYPRHAFAILRDGLDEEKMPKLKDSIDVAKNQKVYYLDSAVVNNATNYFGTEEMRRAEQEGAYELFLPRPELNGWENGGIHALGCGVPSNLDESFCYNLTVAQRIEDEAKRKGIWENNADLQTLVTNLREKGYAVEPSELIDSDEEVEEGAAPIKEYKIVEATEAEMLAVELLIADENALETAFEGTRMYDLIRFARHMNNQEANYGTEWLAWKIARRSIDMAPYENTGVKEDGLYNILLSPENWYLRAPEYK